MLALNMSASVPCAKSIRSRHIRERRFELGFTQDEVAKASGTSHSAVSRLENGSHIPQLPTLRRIAAVMDEALLVCRGASKRSHKKTMLERSVELWLFVLVTVVATVASLIYVIKGGDWPVLAAPGVMPSLHVLFTRHIRKPVDEPSYEVTPAGKPLRR